MYDLITDVTTQLPNHRLKYASLIGEVFGALCVEELNKKPTDRAYSDETPLVVEAWLQKIEKREIQLIIPTVCGQPVAAHWLHDIHDATWSAWAGAYVLPVMRGKAKRGVRSDVWKLVVEHMSNKLGFKHIFANAFHDLRRLTWIESDCGYTKVATITPFRTRAGIPEPNNIYTLHNTPQDHDICLQTVRYLMRYPDARIDTTRDPKRLD